MFTKSTLTETPGLEKAIEDALAELAGMTSDTPEYSDTLKNIERLVALRRIPKQEARKPIDPNTVLTVVANLTGIVAILHYEKANVVASKAVGFIMKLKA